jgi:Protein of unknown function (DUF5131)
MAATAFAGTFLIEEDLDRGAAQQPQLGELGLHQLPRRLPALPWNRKGHVLLPEALSAAEPLPELVLAQQVVQQVFQLVPGPQLFHRAPRASDWKLDPQADFVLVHGATLADRRLPTVESLTLPRQPLVQRSFLSLEPLLGPLPSLHLSGIDWVITGGESGPAYRPLDIGPGSATSATAAPPATSLFSSNRLAGQPQSGRARTRQPDMGPIPSDDDGPGEPADQPPHVEAAKPRPLTCLFRLSDQLPALRPVSPRNVTSGTGVVRPEPPLFRAAAASPPTIG